MKGSPLNAVGDKKTGIIRVDGNAERISYQNPPSSAKTKTTGPMQGPMPQNMLTPSETRKEVAPPRSKRSKPQRIKATKIRATSIGAIDAITGTPLNAVGDTKDGIIKRALTGQRVSNSVETSSQRQSRGLYTKAELKSKSSNKDLSDKFNASLSKPGNKANNPFVNGVDTSVKTPPPPPPPNPPKPPTPPTKTTPKKPNQKTPVSSEPIKTPSLTSKANETSNAKTTLKPGVAVKGYEAKFLNSGKQTPKTEKSTTTTKSTETPKSRKEMKVDKMANKVSDAPKSRKEMRLAKTKNKAAKVKSDYNAGSKGPMEGKAARAKHDRLNKRADRIEKRIAKKNKK